MRISQFVDEKTEIFWAKIDIFAMAAKILSFYGKK